MLSDLQTPGARIRLLREAKGWSQEELAKHVYVTQVAISHWEQNSRRPSRGSQIRLAEALGTSRAFLFGEAVA